MELKFKGAKLIQDGGWWLCLHIENIAQARQFIDSLTDKLYLAILKQHREKRSLNANAYAWVLMDRIADMLQTDKDSVYLTMLERYGVFTHVVVKTQAVMQFKQEYRLCKELGEITVNGTTGVQLQCYFGSSSYDTKQMARLIDGIVSECQQMGIETATPEELARMKGEWDR